MGCCVVCLPRVICCDCHYSIGLRPFSGVMECAHLLQPKRQQARQLARQMMTQLARQLSGLPMRQLHAHGIAVVAMAMGRPSRR